MVTDGEAPLCGQAITVRFGGIAALAGIDMELRVGDILGLIGPNGAGKTTLVNVLTGFQAPTEGEVWVKGHRATRLRPHLVSRLGVARTFQSARLFENMTVLDNVKVAAVASGLSASAALRRSREVLDWTGCGAWAERYASELPYGRERLVGIARALAAAPSFLLLDEPAAGLNRQETEDLGRLIREIPEAAGCGVLLIEHNVPLVMEVCRKIQVLDGGRTLALGNPDEIARNPEVRRAYLGHA